MRYRAEAVDALGVQLRVHGAQQRAVGLPEEGGPLLAEGGAQQVGVTGDVAGGQVRQQVGVRAPAAAAEVAEAVVAALDLKAA